MRLPFTIADAEFRGTVRQAGDFKNDSGDTIQFSERVRFEYEDEEGTTQDIEFAVPQLDEVSDFDVLKLKKGERVAITGVVGEGKRGVYVRPLTVRRLTDAQLKAVGS